MPVMPRDTIDSAYQWNLANIYISDDVFLEALEEARAYPERIAAFQGSVAGSPQALLDYLRLDDEVSVELGKLANYAQRKSDEDTRVARYQDFSSQVTTLCVAVAGAQLKQLKFFADARRYPSTLDAALAGTEVPVEVYQNLLDSVHAHLDSMHDYAALRKRLLGVDELRFWDLYVPVVGDIDMRYTYEEACAIILEALQPLGEEYLAIVREGLANRWIDVYENPGKRSGAYSAGGFGMNPMILLNFQGTLDDVFTLIHEMGHSVHTYLSCHNQPSCYADYVIFVAEVASTCNEALLMDWFLKNRADDPRTRAYLVNHYLEMFRGTLFRQCMFAEFELEINRLVARGEGVTSEALCQLYRDLNARYFGPSAVVDEQIALEWARIPHFCCICHRSAPTFCTMPMPSPVLYFQP